MRIDILYSLLNFVSKSETELLGIRTISASGHENLGHLDPFERRQSEDLFCFLKEEGNLWS